MAELREGYLQTRDGRIYYRSLGDGFLTPLVLLHGGPGFPSDYLVGFESLAVNRRVILYDQLGCGRSDHCEDRPELWQLERFIDELGQVLDELGVQRAALFGNSWGAMLAAGFALRFPERVSGLICASPCLSTRLWLEDAQMCKEEMGEEWNLSLARLEQEGRTESPEFERLKEEFNQRFVCRLVPSPQVIEKAHERFGAHVYRAMWGPAEFVCTGNLKDQDLSDELFKIGVPVLFTCGKYDEARPETVRFYASRIPGAKVNVFHHSAHLAHLEEPGAFFSSLANFLHEIGE